MENMGSNPGSPLTGWWNLDPLTFFFGLGGRKVTHMCFVGCCGDGDNDDSS